MKIIFFGVGEAFDEDYPNTSILMETDFNLLMDCGYSLPPVIWKYKNDQSFLDAIYISHIHSDHCFGLAALLCRMIEEKRKKELTIICNKEIKKTLMQVTELGHQNLFNNKVFPINFLEVYPGKKFPYKNVKFSFAPSVHIVTNLAIKIEYKDKIICYSGDGDFLPQTKSLYQKADLLIHDGYTYKSVTPYHGAIKDVIKMGEEGEIKNIAFTHICRKERKNIEQMKLTSRKIHILLPKPADVFLY